MSLRINNEAPNFTAETTEGTITFHDWIGDGWAILFSHPKDFPTTRSRGTSPPHRPPSSRHRCRGASALADPSNRHASVLLHRCAQKYHDRPR